MSDVRYEWADGRYVMLPDFGFRTQTVITRASRGSCDGYSWEFNRVGAFFKCLKYPSIYDNFAWLFSGGLPARIVDPKVDLESAPAAVETPRQPKTVYMRAKTVWNASAYRDMPRGQFPREEMAIEVCDWVMVDVDLGDGYVSRRGQVQVTRCGFCPSLCLVRLDDGQEKLVRREDIRERAFPRFPRESRKGVGAVDYLDLDLE